MTIRTAVALADRYPPRLPGGCLWRRRRMPEAKAPDAPATPDALAPDDPRSALDATRRLIRLRAATTPAGDTGGGDTEGSEEAKWIPSRAFEHD